MEAALPRTGQAIAIDVGEAEDIHPPGGLVNRSPNGVIGAFAVAGVDRSFHWADAKSIGNRVYVWSTQVSHPTAVRYALANNPDGARLYNRDSVPAAPFRTDHW